MENLGFLGLFSGGVDNLSTTWAGLLGLIRYGPPELGQFLRIRAGWRRLVAAACGAVSGLWLLGGDPAGPASPGAGRLGDVQRVRMPGGWGGPDRGGLGLASGVVAEIVKCLTRTEEARWASAFDRVGGWRGGGRCTGPRWGIPCRVFLQITPLTTPRNKKPSPGPTRCVTIKPDRG